MKKILLLIILNNFCFGQNVIDTLNINKIPQIGDKLCWAASTEMITKYIKKNSQFGQVEIVHKFFKINNCPFNHTTSNACNNANPCNMAFLPEVKNRYDTLFNRIGFNVEQFDNSILKWDTIVSEIKNKRPILIVIPLSGDFSSSSKGNHTVVISGYSIINGIKSIKIKDPWLPCKGQEYVLPYTKFKDFYTTFVTNICFN